MPVYKHTHTHNLVVVFFISNEENLMNLSELYFLSL